MPYDHSAGVALVVQDTAPSAVRIADPIDTIICTTNLIPSFLLIVSLILIEVFAAVAAATIVAAVTAS